MQTYKIEKITSKGKTINYGGGYTEEDMKMITKGYKFNGLFYSKEGTKQFYIVRRENKDACNDM